MLDAIGDTFEFLTREVDAGVSYQTRNPKLRGLRMIPVDAYRNYLVFYRVTAGCVRILYVVHGARDLVRFLAERPRV